VQERDTPIELEPALVKAYAETFLSRWDLYPMQIDDGSYVCVKKPLHLNMVQSHLTGHWNEKKPFTLGTYALAPDNTAKWLCFDADDDDEWQQVWTLARNLKKQGVPTYAEPSRRGGHLWFFFQSPTAAHEARAFGKYLLKSHDIPDSLEIYPKQDQLGDGPGSLVRLPFGVHRKSGKVYHFVDLDGQPLARRISDQIRLLSNPDRVPQSFLEEVLWRDYQDKRRQDKVKEASPTLPDLDTGETLSEAIKNSISVYDLVRQYADLDERGRGHCPLHPDKHQSFGVNREKNYWHCWAGCGGGSVIDFIMCLRERNGEDSSFTATVLAMREMFLK
jgi:hypothetical protein